MHSCYVKPFNRDHIGPMVGNMQDDSGSRVRDEWDNKIPIVYQSAVGVLCVVSTPREC